MTANLRISFPELFSDVITVTALTTNGHQPLTMRAADAQELVGEILVRLAHLSAKDSNDG